MWRQYGAVRSPLGRLMPNAAHNRSDRTCGGNGRSEYSRIYRRSASASMSGLPPLLRGGGSAIASAFSAASGRSNCKNRAAQKRGVSLASCHAGRSHFSNPTHRGGEALTRQFPNSVQACPAARIARWTSVSKIGSLYAFFVNGAAPASAARAASRAVCSCTGFPRRAASAAFAR